VRSEGGEDPSPVQWSIYEIGTQTSCDRRGSTYDSPISLHTHIQRAAASHPVLEWPAPVRPARCSLPPRQSLWLCWRACVCQISLIFTLYPRDSPPLLLSTSPSSKKPPSQRDHLEIRISRFQIETQYGSAQGSPYAVSLAALHRLPQPPPPITARARVTGQEKGQSAGLSHGVRTTHLNTRHQREASATLGITSRIPTASVALLSVEREAVIFGGRETRGAFNLGWVSWACEEQAA
jgi:hypothetical protein